MASVICHMSYCHEMSVCQICFLLLACGKPDQDLIFGPSWWGSAYAFVRTRVEESQLGVGWGMAIAGCMHVDLCYVIPSPLFALATGFRFTAIPLLHEYHCMFCLPLPPFEFANGLRFTAIPLLHKWHCLFCTPPPALCVCKWLSLDRDPIIA